MTKLVYAYKKRKYDEAVKLEHNYVVHMLHQWAKDVIAKEGITFKRGQMEHKGRNIIWLAGVRDRFERQRVVNAVLWTIQSVFWDEGKYRFPDIPRSIRAPLYSETGLWGYEEKYGS